MEINAQAPQAVPLNTPQNLANKPENTSNQNASSQDLQSPPVSDTVNISPAAAAAARLASSDTDDSGNRITSSAQAQQATQAIQQSDSNELLRVQGNPPSNQVLANLLS